MKKYLLFFVLQKKTLHQENVSLLIVAFCMSQINFRATRKNKFVRKKQKESWSSFIISFTFFLFIYIHNFIIKTRHGKNIRCIEVIFIHFSFFLILHSQFSNTLTLNQYSVIVRIYIINKNIFHLTILYSLHTQICFNCVL